MTEVKFVGELPESRHPWSRHRENQALVEKLRDRPGAWAEIDRRAGDLKNRQSVVNRGQNLKRRFPDVECTTRTVGDEIVLYARAVAR